MDNHIRSFVKSISWRIIASLTTILLVFIFTRSWVISFEVRGLEIIMKIFFYYLHERVWDRIRWGTTVR